MRRAQPVKPVREDRRTAWLPGTDLLQRPRWGHVWWGSPMGREEVDTVQWGSAGWGLGRSGQEPADRKEPLLGVQSLAGRTGASEFMWSWWAGRSLLEVDAVTLMGRDSSVGALGNSGQGHALARVPGVRTTHQSSS